MDFAATVARHGLKEDVAVACLDVTREAFRLWVRGKRRISPRHACALSEATGIPKHELRPDLFDAPAQGAAQ